jgi:hypothetical protein
MELTPADIIEAIVDRLVTGADFQNVATAKVNRTGPGELDLDYGDSGHFTLTVTPTPG